MSLFVHTRAGNAVRRPLGGWSRFLATGALCLGLAACGGGGGGGDTASTQPTTGLLVTVVDTYGATIAGATVEATVGSSRFVGTTGQDGRAVVPTPGAVGTASVTASRALFFAPNTKTATITSGETTALTVELVRLTSAAGGSLSTRTSNRPTITSGQTTRLKFEIELVIVGIDFNAIEGLNASNFSLLECKPDPSTDRADCVRGTGPDRAYTPTNGGAPVGNVVAEIIPTNQAVPYAAGLMLDQSASVAASDPTGARLYSAKAFLDRLDAGDWVLLSAFADQAGARIANDPNAEMLGKPGEPKILSVYRPFRDSGTVSNAPSYYSSLDSLAALVGGGTPLYDALELLRGEVTTNGPTDKAKSVVIFTDGDDTTCGDPAQCQTARQTSINAANAANVRIFTIGLSNNVNFEALGELANQTGGAFLFAENSQQLIPLYGSVGRLLSLSLPTYRISWEVETSDPSAFVAGNALLGKVRVTRPGEAPFDVPFIFGITNPIIL